MSKKKIKKKVQKKQKLAKNIKDLEKQRNLISMIEEGLTVEEMMDETGMNIKDLTLELSSIYDIVSQQNQKS